MEELSKRQNKKNIVYLITSQKEEKTLVSHKNDRKN